MGKEASPMLVLYYPDDFAKEKNGNSEKREKCALALGFFDGVHMAHRELIKKAVSLSCEKGLTPAVFTFPAEDEGIKSSAKKIYSTSQKLSILESLGIKLCYVVDFSSVASLSPDEFIENILIGKFGAETVVCGYNFRFGKGASADALYLKNALSALGKDCRIINEYSLDGRTLSSSYVRELLALADMKGAARALGMPYFIEGEVSRGDGRGASLGIPTANLSLSPGAALLKRGVYAAAVYIDGTRYPAITNIGACPTFGARELHSETQIFGEVGDIYGKKIRVYLLDFIREEKLFDSKDKLIMQINVDKKYANAVYMETKWQEIGLN